LQQQNQAKLIAKIIKTSALAQNISLYTKYWRLPKILAYTQNIGACLKYLLMLKIYAHI
jgi:hypothetical protein